VKNEDTVSIFPESERYFAGTGVVGRIFRIAAIASHQPACQHECRPMLRLSPPAKPYAHKAIGQRHAGREQPDRPDRDRAAAAGRVELASVPRTNSSRPLRHSPVEKS